MTDAGTEREGAPLAARRPGARTRREVVDSLVKLAVVAVRAALAALGAATLGLLAGRPGAQGRAGGLRRGGDARRRVAQLWPRLLEQPLPEEREVDLPADVPLLSPPGASPPSPARATRRARATSPARPSWPTAASTSPPTALGLRAQRRHRQGVWRTKLPRRLRQRHGRPRQAALQQDDEARAGEALEARDAAAAAQAPEPQDQEVQGQADPLAALRHDLRGRVAHPRRRQLPAGEKCQGPYVTAIDQATGRWPGSRRRSTSRTGPTSTAARSPIAAR